MNQAQTTCDCLRLPRVAGLPLFPVLALAAVVTSCSREPTAPIAQISEDAVASVNGVPISEAAFRELLTRRARLEPDKFAALEPKEALLEELIRPEAVYAKARAAGFDRRPDIAVAVQRLVVAKFQEEQLAQSPAAAVTDSDILAFYEANQARYTTPARVNGALIFVRASTKATAEKRAELRAKAAALREEVAKRPVDFARLAQQHSDDQATRFRGGETGWLTRDPEASGLHPAVVEALFTLRNSNDITPLVETAEGFHVVKLLGRQPATVRPLAAVSEAIRYQITRQKEEQRQRDFYATMKEGLDIRINRVLLESISPPARNDAPPQTPGGHTAQLVRQP